MMTIPADLIDQLADIAPGSRIDTIRARRPQARANAQGSYLALFHPSGMHSLSGLERFAVAAFVAGLHGQARARAHYAQELLSAGGAELAEAIEAEIDAGATTGPYGTYPPGPLSAENQAGVHYSVSEAGRATLGARLAAALAHAHLLVFRPRDASPEALRKLIDSGLDTTEIVTLSQLVSFLTFQLRVVAGLEALAAAGEAQ